jgi:hypothetical protein
MLAHREHRLPQIIFGTASANVLLPAHMPQGTDKATMPVFIAHHAARPALPPVEEFQHRWHRLASQALSRLRRLEAKTSGVPHDVATERRLADYGIMAPLFSSFSCWL